MALYTVLDTAVQLEIDPPEMMTSDVTKSLAASESVKVRVDLSPKLKELSASSSVMAIVGEVVSMTMSLLYASEPLPVITGRVSVALLFATSWIVPPLSKSEDLSL